SLCSLVHPFFLHATAPTAIYPLSLHDALPIFHFQLLQVTQAAVDELRRTARRPGRIILHFEQSRLHPSRLSVKRNAGSRNPSARSEEHTSELQSRENLVCRLLLEKKKLSFSFRLSCLACATVEGSLLATPDSPLRRYSHKSAALQTLTTCCTLSCDSAIVSPER